MDPELFIALVTPVGVRRADLIAKVKRTLLEVGYKSVDIKLSELLKRCRGWSDSAEVGEANRITHLQNMGNKFRSELGDGAALARAALVAIRESRLAAMGSPEKLEGRTAYILDQLKHPSEIDFFRDVYDSCFYAISAHASSKKREDELAAIIARQAGRPGEADNYRAQAHQLITSDDIQEGEFGQNTRDTYPKSDFFIDMSAQGGEQEMERFIELLFAHPFHTPTRAEYVMYQASAAARRSSDDSRQVGAAIATEAGDVIAVGSNEVPMRGGGLYWSNESPDTRDQKLVRDGDDRAGEIKASALIELLERLEKAGWLIDAKNGKALRTRALELLPSLRGTQFMNIGEFGRTVHAEMAALIDAARRGVPVNGHTMYVTTFPCHNCAKHIIAAGIKKVIYLEPYPKSRANFLHGEEIDLDPQSGAKSDPRVVAFHAFSGIAPRQYHQLFSMNFRGKRGVALKNWHSEKSKLPLRYTVRNAYLAYLAAEREELSKLPAEKFNWEREKICP